MNPQLKHRSSNDNQATLKDAEGKLRWKAGRFVTTFRLKNNLPLLVYALTAASFVGDFFVREQTESYIWGDVIKFFLISHLVPRKPGRCCVCVNNICEKPDLSQTE